MAEALQNEMLSVNEARNAPVAAVSVSNAASAISGTPTRGRPLQTTAAINADAAAPTISTPINNTSTKGKMPKPPDEFYRDLQQFHERRATTITHKPKISGREVDLHKLYSEVTERGGFYKVNQRDEWDEVLPVLGIPEKCVNATAAVKYIYRRCLEKYEKQNFLGEDPDKLDPFESGDAIESGGGRSRSRYPPTVYASTGVNVAVNTVPMSYNYRQHIVNMDRRRTYKLSTDLHKASPYEKLMLSLISPLPNEQDFAINVCSLMANENKHTLKLNEYPKLLDMLLAHSGVFSDYTLRELFQHVYTQVREHSLFGFWCDLLHDKPQILELYTDEQAMHDAGVTNDIDDCVDIKKLEYYEDCGELDFLNLGRGEGTQEYVGQRVQQIVAIFRNLSFFEENVPVMAKSRTFVRFIVMGANIRWANLHNQILDIAGNIATEIELLDPSTDDVSRSLLATICDGVESLDRGVIINSLEILYKLCQRDSNEEAINKCLNLRFYETVCQFLCLNDIMLLIFTLESVYALTSLGTRSCHLVMQVRGIIDQLVSLITVEAQAYGPDGCILMRVVETVPGNMLPMVAQNIANLQNAAVAAKPTAHLFTTALQLPAPQPPLPTPVILPPQITSTAMTQSQTQTQPTVPLPPVTADAGQILQQQTTHVEQPATIATQAVTLVEQPVTTTTPTPQQSPNLPQAQQSTPQEDEQYALAWLGATFERTTASDCRIDQQELYRIYLTHCQKTGKHSFVNHVIFPKLVRLIYSNNAGPVTVRISDGSSLPGLHYVGIRLRAQPLPIQPMRPKTPDSKLATDALLSTARRLKKKPKLPQETPNTIADALTATTTSATSTTTNLQEPMDVDQTTSDDLTAPATTMPTVIPSNSNAPSLIVQSAQSSGQTLALQQDAAAQPSSSLIKSLLANKVNQRQQKNQKDLNTIVPSSVPSPQPSVSTNITTNASVNQPIKVAGTAISTLVGNTLMQNTALKVGQTTIKPLNHSHNNPLEKKPMLESTPPPLAPLSGNNVAKDSSGRPVIIANQILVDRLDKKAGESSIQATIIKRKIEDSGEPAKRPALEPLSAKVDEVQVTPSKNAANLYAEMAASILEDEDLEDIPPLPVTTSASSSTINTQSALSDPIPQQQILIPAKIQQSAIQGVQRQLLFQSNQSPQLKLATHSAGGIGQTTQLPTAMATIKTDQGLQTVPVILQQKTLEQTQPQQLQLQQVITQNMPQQQQQQQPTQYVLATNHQGQTYLVAQQPQPPPPPPQQTVLVTQTPQQQSAGTKTIIILQQQPLSGQQQTHQPQLITTSGTQKMIMTTPQGQQVLVTQRTPQPTLSAHPTTQQYFINPQTGTATPIQHIPVSSSGITTNVSSSNQLIQRHQLIPTSQITTIAQSQPATAQISQSLLSQLNHIPATIKLHQPQLPPTSLQQQTVTHQHQPATISRLGKTVSIVQASPGLATAPPPPPIQIPQLQQHQSIIQQHIISGPSEKRQVILGGRAIEIKETVITQAPPPTQQSQLNSQTIITKQILPTQQQPQQQQIRPNTIEQQQQLAQIIQQKILPKPADHPSLIQATLPVKSESVVQTVSQQQIAPPVRTPTPQQQTIAGSEPPPLAQSANLSRSATAAQQSQQVTQQQTEISRNNEATNTTNNTASPSSATTTSATVTTAATVIAAATATVVSKPVTPPPPSQSPAPPQRPPSTPAITAAAANMPQTPIQKQTLPIPQLPQVQLPPVVAATATAAPPLDPNWLFVCDWRNCPRRKFKSLNELQHHACTLHCPDHLDSAAEIFCQWGVGPGLCDGIPRKRYSLMTHIIDRHLTNESLRAAMQRRIATNTVNIQSTQSPVTIVRNVEAAQAQAQAQRNNTASPAPSTSSSSSCSTTASQPPIGIGNATGSSAMHAIKRHTADYVNPKELMDENEGPVTKSIRLTAALILRNLVTYNNTAKRSLRSYEPHLSNVALSNVESSVAIAHILYEINN